MVGEVAQRLDPVDPGEAAVADDRDPIAGPLDLAEDVARQEDRPTLGLGLADELVERLLDERVESRRRLVQDEQVRPVLEGDDEADLLLVALRVLLEPPRWVDLEPLDEARLVGPVDAAAEAGEVAQRLAAGQAVVQAELAGDVAETAVDRDSGRRSSRSRRCGRRRSSGGYGRGGSGSSSSCRRRSGRGNRRPRPNRPRGRRRRSRGGRRTTW